MLDEFPWFKRTRARRNKPMLNIPSSLWLLLEADNLTGHNDFQVCGADLGESRDGAKTSTEATVIKFSGIFMGNESNRLVFVPEPSTEKFLSEQGLTDGDPMAANVPTDTNPSTANRPPKKKYSPAILTTYGTVRELTKQNGGSGTLDGGTVTFVKTHLP